MAPFRPLLAALLLGILSGLLAPAGRAQDDQPATLSEGLRLYAADAADLDRWLTVGPSAHRLDRLDALARRWTAWLEELDFESLGPAERVDALLLRRHLEHGVRQRAAERDRMARLAPALPFAAEVVALEEARWTLEPVDPPVVAARLSALAGLVGDVSSRACAADAQEPADDALLLSDVDALWLSRQVGAVTRALDAWREHHDAYDPGFGWWVDEPADALREGLLEYARVLREDVARQQGEDDDPLVGDPLGRDGLLVDLAAEWIAYTPEELVALGEAQLRWCEARMLEASRALGHGDDWKAALEQVKGMHVAPGDQDDLVAGLGREMVAWLDARDLVTIPDLCRETWRVRMLSRDAQRTLPFAAYGGQHMLVAFPTDDMDHDAKLQAMRGNNVPFTRLVTPHELIPGHHLQGFMAQRHGTWRRPFSTPFYGEGWALYWEMLEWDEGWARTPEERIGMLFWRMHRAARIVFSLRFHLGDASPQECIDLLVERVGHERDNATAEVRRSIAGDYSPLYQCAYMVGALQLRGLADELVGSGAMTPRAFHDAVLRQGSVPIEALRALLTATPLPADHEPSWRFAGEL